MNEELRLEEKLCRSFEHIEHLLRQLEEKLMSGLSDLQDQISALQSNATNVAATLTAIEAKLATLSANTITDADLEALSTQVASANTVITSAIATATPTPTPTPAPAQGPTS